MFLDYATDADLQFEVFQCRVLDALSGKPGQPGAKDHRREVAALPVIAQGVEEADSLVVELPAGLDSELDDALLADVLDGRRGRNNLGCPSL